MFPPLTLSSQVTQFSSLLWVIPSEAQLITVPKPSRKMLKRFLTACVFFVTTVFSIMASWGQGGAGMHGPPLVPRTHAWYKERKKVKSLSPVQLFATPWTVTHQAPPSMGFSRQQYWSELPSPSPGDLPNPETEPKSPTLQEDAFTVWATRDKPRGKCAKVGISRPRKLPNSRSSPGCEPSTIQIPTPLFNSQAVQDGGGLWMWDTSRWDESPSWAAGGTMILRNGVTKRPNTQEGRHAKSLRKWRMQYSTMTFKDQTPGSV